MNRSSFIYALVILVSIAGCSLTYKPDDIVDKPPDVNYSGSDTNIDRYVQDALYKFNLQAKELDVPPLTVSDVAYLNASDIEKLRLSLRYSLFCKRKK